jgi:hypothetical protein
MVLVTGTFFPVLDMVCSVLKLNIDTKRLVFTSLVLAALFLLITSNLPMTTLRIMTQMVIYFIVVYFALNLGFKTTLKVMVAYMLVTFTTEYVILQLLEETLIGFKQLLEIDTFYGLTISMHSAVLFVMDFAVKHRFRRHSRTYEAGNPKS